MPRPAYGGLVVGGPVHLIGSGGRAEVQQELIRFPKRSERIPWREPAATCVQHSRNPSDTAFAKGKRRVFPDLAQHLAFLEHKVMRVCPCNQEIEECCNGVLLSSNRDLPGPQPGEACLGEFRLHV